MAFNYNVENEFYFENLLITKEKFESMFGNESTYGGLIKHEKCTPAWKDVFYEMKQKGILN